MTTEKKVTTVTKLKELMEQNRVLIATSYRGISVAEMTTLRRKLKSQGIEYHVVKNTLARRAAKETGRAALEPFLQGPVALGFTSGEESAAAKAFLSHIASAKSALVLSGAVIGATTLEPKRVTYLASLPPRGDLQAKLLGQLQAPLGSMVFTLKAPLISLVTVLKASLKEREGGTSVA